ncbi:unnamed protein product [Phytophthora fragariaefolia]|uniref:Unnamed protein product n=1 Tax=Phytophthora fragariaefolia TaxID=1490495 RepID=A0A9W6U8K8_9STRA|nr:unnamed protein product [Phytophthora fragariaefolia]
MSEKKLVNAIENINSSVINDTIPDVMGIMASNLKMDLSQKDVKARILGYLDCMEEAIELHGLAGCLKDNVKLTCKVTVENLRPATPRKQVTRALECDPSLKSDLHRLFDLVKQEAIRNQQAYDMYQHMRKRDNGARDDKNNIKQPDNSRLQIRKDKRRPRVKPSHKKWDGLPPVGCLHCKRSDHWLEDCQSATEANKKDAMKAFLGNKSRGKEASTVKRLVTNDPPGESEVIFNDLVAMPYCLDNGTTHNVIPRSIVDELQLLDPNVTLKALEPPVQGKAVGGTYITCTQSVDLDIGLQTVAGRVNIRGLTCVTIETNEDEFSFFQLALAAESQECQRT